MRIFQKCRGYRIIRCLHSMRVNQAVTLKACRIFKTIQCLQHIHVNEAMILKECRTFKTIQCLRRIRVNKAVILLPAVPRKTARQPASNIRYKRSCTATTAVRTQPSVPSTASWRWASLPTKPDRPFVGLISEMVCESIALLNCCCAVDCNPFFPSKHVSFLLFYFLLYIILFSSFISLRYIHSLMIPKVHFLWSFPIVFDHASGTEFLFEAYLLGA